MDTFKGKGGGRKMDGKEVRSTDLQVGQDQYLVPYNFQTINIIIELELDWS